MSTNPLKFFFIQGQFRTNTVAVFPNDKILNHFQGWGRNQFLLFQEQKFILKINEHN